MPALNAIENDALTWPPNSAVIQLGLGSTPKNPLQKVAVSL